MNKAVYSSEIYKSINKKRVFVLIAGSIAAII